MIVVKHLRLPPGEDERRLKALAARALRCSAGALTECVPLRRSLDARDKRDIHWDYAVKVSAEREERLLRRAGADIAEPYRPFVYHIPRRSAPYRPVVAGFGPAGMFAALVLAEAGLRPIVLERGGDAEERRERVARFRETGALDPENNVQFGEGGAGTFSDGKLATGTHDPRIAWVLARFAEFGAGAHVTVDARPHVGTDRLLRVVRALRERVTALGGEVWFHTRLTGYERAPGGDLRAALAETPAGPVRLPCRALVLALGHSARDSFEMLSASGLPLAAKPFAMGVRVEHRQAAVDAAQYGKPHPALPPAEYRGSVRLPGGGSVYTFCMCPGGYVMAAASEAGGVVTNGMSYSGRAGENANAALLVSLRPEDFPSPGPLAGMYWQRELERACFACGGGNYLAPAQTVGDFLARRPSAGPGGVAPSYRPGVVWGELREALPPVLTEPLAEAIPLLSKRLRFFSEPDAVLTAPETRSSSPVRILRGERLQSEAVPGLYPCGEGAGYAGGITSAAVDGMRCAEAILDKLQ